MASCPAKLQPRQAPASGPLTRLWHEAGADVPWVVCQPPAPISFSILPTAEPSDRVSATRRAALVAGLRVRVLYNELPSTLRTRLRVNGGRGEMYVPVYTDFPDARACVKSHRIL